MDSGSLSRADQLAHYLGGVVGKTHVYGVHDCATFVGGWVRFVRGFDPSDDFKALAREKCLEEALQHERGLARGAARAFESRGLTRIKPADARLGDVGVVRLETGGVGLAIKSDDAWLILINNGFGIVKVRCFIAWEV